MKPQHLIPALLLVFSFPFVSVAQTVSLADADRIFNFAEVSDPNLFGPPVQTQQANVGESDWFFREYTNSGAILAININGYGPFYSGDVYGAGAAFGNQVQFLETMPNVLALIDSQSPVVTLEDANALLDFAESAEPGLFSPPAQTQLVNESGNSWYVRSYASSGISIKINLNGTSPFMAGGVYVVGGSYGEQEVFIDSLENLLTLVGGASSTDTRSAITKAKDFVSDLRDLTASAQIAAFEDELGAFGNSVTLAFEEQINFVSGIVTNDVGEVMSAIALAFDAFGAALEALELNPGLTSFDAEYNFGLLVITVMIAENENGPILTVDQNIDGVAVALSANGNLSYEETVEGLAGESETSIALNISGSAVNDEFSMVIQEGSEISATISESYSESESGLEASDNATLSDVVADLSVSLTALQADNNPTFDGQFGFNITDLVVDHSTTIEQSETQSVQTFTEILSVDALEFQLAGAFSDDTENSVGASLTFAVDNPEGQNILFELTESSTVTFNPYTFFSFSETSSNETADSFLAVNVFLQIDVSLPGIDNTSLLTFDANRTGLEDGAATITLEFDEKFLEFDANTASNAVTVSNQDDAVAQVSEHPLTGLLEGTITVDGLEVGTIEELSNGILIVRYADDTFESFAL